MPLRKLTQDDVKVIRQCYAEKKRIEREFSRKGLARKFGVCYQTIDRILDGQTWRERNA